MGLRSEVARRTPWSCSNTTRDRVAAGHADLKRDRAGHQWTTAVLGFGWAVIQPCAGHVEALG
jgi:hypothetical protein